MKVREELQEITKENNNAYGISEFTWIFTWVTLFVIMKHLHVLRHMKMYILRPLWNCVLSNYHVHRGITPHL